MAKNCSLVYKEMLDIPAGDFFSPWPKLDRTRYVTLALVTNHSMTRDDDFTHRTLRKSEDDIPHHKYAVPYDSIFPKELTTNSCQILISGRPGAGKTVLLTKVSKDWAKGECLTNIKLLIHVSLRQLAVKSMSPTLEDVISLFSSQSDTVRSLCEDIEKVNGEGVCFAFDGLDEYPNRSKPYDYIMKLIRKEYLPLASVIVTSRPTATSYVRSSSMDKHVEIVGFMPEQIIEYITDYYEKNKKPDSPNASDILISYLKSHPNVLDMCYLPLHLAMILYIDQYRGDDPLPETETGIYTFFISHSVIRYIRRDGSKFPKRIRNLKDLEKELNEENKSKLFWKICFIAFRTKLSSQLIFGSSDLEDNFPEQFSRRSDIDEITQNGLGILSNCTQKFVDGEEPQFSFQHLTVQEFLGAYYLSRRSHDECLEYIKSHGNSSDLREFWRYFIGLTKSSDYCVAFYNELLAANTSGRSDTLFLARCLFEAQGSSKSRECCAAFLQSREGTVNVSNIVLNSPDCSAIGYTVSQCPDDLKQLVMNYCQVGPGGIDALNYQMDKHFPNIHNMQIRSQSNPVGGDGGTNLKTILEKMEKLDELRLYGNRLSNKKLKELQPVITPMTNLRILVLTKNDLGPESGVTIGAVLCNLRNLIQFYASYNPIGTEGLKSLLPGLLNCTKLKRLGFRDCQLTSDSGILISQVLSKLHELEQLELYLNQLGDEGITDMVHSLRDAPQLKQFSLTQNGITDKGGCLLAEVVVKTNPSIEQIRVFYNEMSDETRKAFYDANKYREQCDLCPIKYAI